MKYLAARTGSPSLPFGEVGVEVGDSFDAAKIIFQGDVLVGSVGVLVWQTEAQKHTGNFKGVVHLGDEGDRAAFADEHGLFAEALFERGLRFLEDRIVVRSGPRLSFTQDFKFAVNRFGQQFSNVLLDELRDLVRILVGNEARREFCTRF